MGIAPEVRQHHGILGRETGKGHDQIAQRHDGRGHEHVMGCVEIALHEGVVPALRLCIAGRRKRVGPIEVGHLDGIGLLGLKGRQDGIRMAHGAGSIGRMVFFGIDALGEHLRVNVLAGLEAPAAHEAGGQCQDDAARDVHVTTDSRDGQHGLTGLGPILLSVEGQAPHDG